MCGGGGPPPPPPPSATEEALRQKQLDLLNQQDRLNQMFQPIQAENLGYKPIYGTNPEQESLLNKIREATARAGGDHNAPEPMALRQEYTKRGWDSGPQNVITGYEKTAERAQQEKDLSEINALQMQTSKRASKALNDYLDSLDTPEAKAAQAKQKAIETQQQEIALKQGERQKLALEGALPVSTGTTQRENEEFMLLKERMARSGNPIIGDNPGEAYSLTTSGNASLESFKKRYDAVKEQERRGELDAGGSLYLQSVGLAGDIGSRSLAQAQGLSGPGGLASANPIFTRGNPFQDQNMSLVSGYGAAMNPYMQDRQLQYQSGVDQSQYRASQQAGYLGLAGQGLGMATTAAMLMSSKESKKKIVPLSGREGTATSLLSKAKLYRWQYKDEPDNSKGHIGVIAEEAPKDLQSDDGKHIDIASYLGLLTKSVQEINQRLDKKGA